jgi:hypothetical protein
MGADYGEDCSVVAPASVASAGIANPTAAPSAAATAQARRNFLNIGLEPL